MTIEEAKLETLDPRISGEVLAADDGELFLVGGAHAPLQYTLGLRQVHPNSFKNFRENLVERAAYCESLGIKYLHLVAPDKQSVLRESFGVANSVPLGELYAAQSGADFIFPVTELRGLQPGCAYEPTDTHWAAEGAGLIARLLAQRFGLPEVDIAAGEELLAQSLEPRTKPFTGDLGRKMEQPRSNLGLMRSVSFPVRHFDSYTEGNTGTMRLAIPLRRDRRHRLLIFGDSFLQVSLKELTAFFGEVLLCRSAFLHREIVQSFQPDYVVTENAERYLSTVRSDREAPPFLFYPQITRRNVVCSPDSVEALTAALRFDSNLYFRFMNKFDAKLDEKSE